MMEESGEGAADVSSTADSVASQLSEALQTQVTLGSKGELCEHQFFEN